MGLMKYMTLEWWGACGQPGRDVEACEAEPRRYMAWLETVRDRLPVDMTDPPDGLDWHDAHLRSLRVDLANQVCEMILDAWGPDWREQRKLSVVFRGVSEVISHGDPECGLLGPYGWGDLGYVEFDVTKDERREWRGVFSNGIELLIRFESVEYLVGPVVRDAAEEL
jgi:hypothetical protein